MRLTVKATVGPKFLLRKAKRKPNLTSILILALRPSSLYIVAIVSKYQIYFCGNNSDSRLQTLRETVLLRCRELGIEPDAIAFFDDATISSRDRKSPTVGAFLSLSTNPPSHPSVAEFVRDGFLIVPVVPDLARFTDFVPKELLGINGMAFRTDDPKMEAVACVLLEGLNLVRKSRRLFISYRRSKTQGVAIQLYEELDRGGFDVFLDTLSIRPGEPFQEVLWHRLADTDVIVLLDSPGFLSSRWTTTELATANSTNIQILHIIWPGNKLEAAGAFSKAIQLDKGDFQSDPSLPDARLTDAVAQKMTIDAESLRARALAARYTSLVEEFYLEARQCGMNPHVQPERFITIELNSGNFVAAVPTVGLPDAVRYQEIEDVIEQHPTKHSEVVLLYDERGIRDKWQKHLTWLDRQKLRVRSMQITQCSAWLRGLT